MSIAGLSGLKEQLNNALPANANVQLGSLVDSIVAKHNALCAALDEANITGLGQDNAATFGMTLPTGW